ncbi:MAG: response regulator transcription factor [Desulfovibrionaceae bacterium]|nr:response regulator transcription factor [Desulfovibrionaceae bacterium]
MTGQGKVLVVEDDADILNLLALNLRSEGYGVLTAESGETGLRLILTEKPDLVLLDLMLPDISGVDVCRAVKGNTDTRRIPVIMLTARGEEADRITGFESGADDYVVKPFSPRELMLRIKAVLKRNAGGCASRPRWERDGLALDFEAHTFLVDGREVWLTSTEFNLLDAFVRNPGKVLNRERLLSEVWGYEFEGYSRTVDTHMRRLRKKLGPYAALLETVRGVGYRLTA